MNTRYIIKQPEVLKSVSLHALFWLLGLSLGVFLSFFSPDNAANLLRTAMSQSSSPVTSLLVSASPIAILVAARKRTLPMVTCPLFLFTGTRRGYCGMLAFIAFHSGTWLIRSLFLFSAGSEAVLMWYFLIHHCETKGQTFKQDIQCIAVIFLATFAIDQLFISPFLSDLVKYI